jgi:hypothetical protein
MTRFLSDVGGSENDECGMMNDECGIRVMSDEPRVFVFQFIIHHSAFIISAYGLSSSSRNCRASGSLLSPITLTAVRRSSTGSDWLRAMAISFRSAVFCFDSPSACRSERLISTVRSVS